MSWGWFEDHILNSFFSINLEITTGKNVESKQLQSVRSVFNDGKIDDRQYVRGQKCHISRNLHSKGLDTVIQQDFNSWKIFLKSDSPEKIPSFIQNLNMVVLN